MNKKLTSQTDERAGITGIFVDLAGILKGVAVDKVKEEYIDYLEEKYLPAQPFNGTKTILKD